MPKIFIKILFLAIVAAGLHLSGFRLGRTMQSAKDAYRAGMSQVEMKNTGMAIAANYRTNGDLPARHDFGGWLRQHIGTRGKRPDLDYFDQPYRLELTSECFAITSDGPDRTPGTEDDLEEQFELKPMDTGGGPE